MPRRFFHIIFNTLQFVLLNQQDGPGMLTVHLTITQWLAAGGRMALSC